MNGSEEMPNKNNNRMGRIDEEYRKELSQIIGFELKNSSITGMISVTKVKVTPDLKYAKVYVSIFNSKNIKVGMKNAKFIKLQEIDSDAKNSANPS